MNQEPSVDDPSASRDPTWPSPPVSSSWTPPPPPPPGRGRRPRRTRRALVAAAIAVGVVAAAAIGVRVGVLTRGSPASTAVGGASPSASAGPATNARTLLLQALAATRRSVGFHYVATSTGDSGTQTITGDAGQSDGQQVITIGAGTGKEQFTLVLVSGTVYFKGNVPALEDQMGVPSAGASALDGKWVAVSSQDGPYGVVAPGITVSDQAQEIVLVPTSTAPARSADGVTTTRIMGTVPPQQGAPGGTAHLDVAPASHLPVSYVSAITTSGATVTSTTTFSGWGTAAPETAPAGAVAWATLGASAPPGGYGSGGTVAPAPSPTAQI